VKAYTSGGGKDVVKLLVGNKVDKADERQVTRKEGEAWAKQRGMLFIEASAKTDVGIQQVFDEVVNKVLENPVLLHNTVPKGAKLLDSTKAAGDGQQGTCC
jgi:Ras-related protein Rab-18